MKRQTSLLNFLNVKVQKTVNQNDQRSSDCECEVDKDSAVTYGTGVSVAPKRIHTIDTMNKSVQSASASTSTFYPSIWSSEQWLSFSEKNPWLIASSGKLGCGVCREINLQGFGALKDQGIAPSPEWCGSKVEPSLNENRSTQLSNLRVKIKKHAESKAHRLAEDIKHKAAKMKDSVADLIRKESKQVDNATAKVFRTVYYLAKSNRPFTDLEGLINLQERNDINLGTILHSRYSATQIVEHISKEMKKRLTMHIVQNKAKLSVLVDESSTLGRKSVLIIYVCVVLSVQPIFMFLDLVELADQGAEHIADILIKTLNQNGYTNDYLSQNWVSFVSDGASVMTGKKSGVASRIASKFPAILSWHCMSHRLELAVGDALKNVTATNHFQAFLDCIYSLYSQSNKNQEELRKSAAELELQILKIGRIFDTRWLASSYRTVEAIWRNFPALYLHFTTAAKDLSRDGRTRQKFNGLAGKLSSPEFVKNIAIMYDCLKELGNLSLELQRRNTTLKRADECIKRTIRVLESFKTEPGEKMTKVLTAIEAGNFKQIVLKKNKVQEINSRQFLQSLIDNMKRRLTDDQSSVLVDLQILDKSSWPDNVSIRFGENEIKRLSTRFHLDSQKAINGMREYVETNESLPEDLQDLQRLVKTFPCSTAECERGFSAMNLIMTKLRSSLLIANISNLMTIKINGPPLIAFNAEPYVKSWLTKHRSATDTQSRKVSQKPITDEDAMKELWTVL